MCFRHISDLYNVNKETRIIKGISSSIHYGFSNYLWSGGLRGYYLVNPKNKQSIIIDLGRYVRQFNENNPIDDLFNAQYTLWGKNNFIKLYQKDVLQIKYNHELFNGFFMNSDIQYNSREAMLNNSFFYFTGPNNKHFTSNNPQYNDGADTKTKSFDKHESFQLKLAFKWIPFAKYETYPTHPFQ